VKTAVEPEPFRSEFFRMDAAREAETGKSMSVSEPPDRAVAAPPDSTLHTLQRCLGNRATSRVLSGVLLQPKLTVGSPEDIYEKEADAVAEQVIARTSLSAASGSDEDNNDSPGEAGRAANQRSMQGGVLRRIPLRTLQPTLGNRALARLLQQTFSAPATPALSRKCACGGDAKSEEECAECSEKKSALQRSSARADVADMEAPPIVESVLASPGQPLATSARSTLEPGFGHEFSSVRIHDDSRAAESAAAVNALAYTVGNHIVFGAGQYSPGTADGNRLLAHELTHTIQQTGGNPTASLQQTSLSRAEIGSVQRTEERSVQRVHVDGAGRKAFDCPDFAGDKKLEACLNDQDRLSPGEESPTVAKVQRGLLKDGLDLGKNGADQKYGPATAKAVQAFKTKWHLGFEQYADVGPGTMAKLDELCAGNKPVPPPPVPPAPTPTPPATCPPCPEDPRTAGCQPCPPTPNPAPEPRANCSDVEARKIANALNTAVADLQSALGLLDRSSPLREDALWLAFRSTGEGDVAAIRSVLTKVHSGLPGAKIECSDPGILKCSDQTDVAATNIITGTIFLCRNHLSELGPRPLIHEGCHAFAGLNAGGELYFEEDCGEGDVVGQSRAFRLQNADSFACFVELLTHSGEVDLGARARHTKGEDLALVQKPAGAIKLSGPESAPTFSLAGYHEVGIKGMQWILKDDSERRYLLRKGEEVIEPDTEVDWVSGIIIGAKTRALLHERGITRCRLFVVSRIPEVGKKTVELSLTFEP
jgi:hypothetical protein